MPINPDLFAAFCLAAAALVVLPGPVVTLVVANSLKHGTRTGILTVLGAGTGNVLLMILGAVGVTTILTLLADLATVVRWAGAAYLIWLGLREWRAGGRIGADDPDGAGVVPARSVRGILGQAFLIGITNPKAILFYLAFFPQFVDPALPAAPQLAAMVAAFFVIALALDGTYALISGRLRRLMASPRFARLRARITGSLLIVTGLGLVLVRR